MGKKEVNFKGTVAYDRAIAYLDELVSGLKSGTVYVQNGKEYVPLRPTKLIEIDVTASQKKDREKFSLELSWSIAQETSEEVGLKILTTEPEAEPVASESTEGHSQG